jgi:hypothetical protein
MQRITLLKKPILALEKYSESRLSQEILGGFFLQPMRA